MNIYVYNELTQKTQLMLVENTEFEENEINKKLYVKMKTKQIKFSTITY